MRSDLGADFLRARGRKVSSLNAVPTEAAEAAIPEVPATPATLRRNARYRRSLALADACAAGMSLLLAVSVVGGRELRPTVVLAAPLLVLVSKIVGLYDRDADLLHRTTLDEAPALFHVATLSTLLAWLADEYFVVGKLNGSQIVVVWGLLFLAMLCTRAGARFAVRRLSSTERCLVVGDAGSASFVRNKLAASEAVSAEVVGRVALTPGEPDGGDVVLLGDLASLPALLEEHEVERVIIAPSTASAGDETLTMIRLVKALGVKVSILPRLFEAVGSSVRFDDIEGLTLLGVPSYGLTKSSRLLKRSMDVTAAGLGLVLLLPVLLAISLLVKLTSRGPVFFGQVRIGRHGREFEMLKFRTMVHDADNLKTGLVELNEADGLFKIANDPRITRVGRFLRRFSLDELPQLWHVLRGQMSLVGPRPLVPEEDQQMGGWERRRLEVLPGMTGIWQVLGSARIPLSEMVKLDYLYGANWSLWLDCKILLRTAHFMLARRGL